MTPRPAQIILTVFGPTGRKIILEPPRLVIPVRASSAVSRFKVYFWQYNSVGTKSNTGTVSGYKSQCWSKSNGGDRNINCSETKPESLGEDLV